ncbi:MAG TPA: HK97 family phage prohead protease [Gaiellaceae bacterium]|nr:HK97 family phage prohead protease [Gaiellaceae bacterium]
MEELPPFMQRIARHLMAERSMPEPKAVAVAIQTARKFCASGDTNWPGRQSINLGSRAEACAAVTRWGAMKAAAKGRPLPEAPKASVRPSAGKDSPKAPVKPKPEPKERRPVSERVTEKPWDGSPERFTDSEWARSCALDRGPEITEVRERYSLPVREPDGTLNRSAVHAAVSLLERIAGASAAVIAAAARLLLAAFRALRDEPPESLRRLAQRSERRTGEGEMNELEQRTIDVDVNDLDVRGNTIHGFAATYGPLSEDLGGFKEKIAPGAFAEVLSQQADVRALLNHDPSALLGRTKSGTLRLHDEERGLRFELDLPDSPLGANVREAVRRKDLDGASFRFRCAEDQWEGEVRTITRVAELHDVSLATTPAYPSASIELRTRPTIETTTEEPNMETEARTTQGGGLTVEDRSAVSDTLNIESRTLLGHFNRAGFVPGGRRTEIPWAEFEAATESRALTWTGSVDLVNGVTRVAAPLGFDVRYAWPAFLRVPVDSAVTSVNVLTQTARTLPTAANVVRAIDAVTNKPESASTVAVVVTSMKQVAAVTSGVPNIMLEQGDIETVIGGDLRLSYNEGLDKLILDAISAAGFQAPGTDPLLTSIRKAVTTLWALGYSPDVVLLTPAAAETLDLLTTVGTEKIPIFPPASSFAPRTIFGMTVRVSKTIAAPAIVDSRAFGKLYAGPVSLASFEENAGKTNSSLVRFEGNAAFGVERQNAAVRIAAS